MWRIELPEWLQATLVIFCAAVILILATILGIVVSGHVRKARRQREKAKSR